MSSSSRLTSRMVSNYSGNICWYSECCYVQTPIASTSLGQTYSYRKNQASTSSALFPMSKRQSKLSSPPLGSGISSPTALHSFSRISNSNVPVPCQTRAFSVSSRTLSAWPAGHDVGGTAPTHASEKPSDRYHIPPGEQAITMASISDAKRRGEPIAVVTAYHYPSALSLRSAEVDICLVGDSLANVALGHRTTHPLTLQAMIHHVQAVARGLRHPALHQHGMPPVPLLIADVPYGYTETSMEEGVRATTSLVKDGGADGVKIEGGKEVVPLVTRLSSFGIPVMAHIGLQPQRSSSGSALNLAGRTSHEAMDMLDTALALQKAGAFAIVLECIPARVGKELTSRLDIATIGIGAGNSTDGQVLVGDDIMGEVTSPLQVLAGVRKAESIEDGGERGRGIPQPAPQWPVGPRFARNFVAPLAYGSSLGALRLGAVQSYVSAVKSREFPSDTETYKMKKEEWSQLKEALALWDSKNKNSQA